VRPRDSPFGCLSTGTHRARAIRDQPNCVALPYLPTVRMMSMAMARKNSRRIVVDNQPYRWRLRSRPTYAQGLCWTPCRYAVEDYDRPGRRLVVTTDQPHPSNWLGRPAGPVLPAQVAQAIRIALQLGWDPSSTGAPFHLNQDGVAIPSQ
jgi:hypothetical protein